jgi:hypothetical protein
LHTDGVVATKWYIAYGYLTGFSTAVIDKSVAVLFDLFDRGVDHWKSYVWSCKVIEKWML